MCGISGDYSLGVDLFAWVERGRIAEDYPSYQTDKDDGVGMLIIDNGKILKYERSPIPMVIEDATFAIGSGRDFALATMHCGKTAKEAVEVACVFESGCGNGVDTLEL